MHLLDTNVVSELRKVRLGKADPHVAAWADRVDERRPLPVGGCRPGAGDRRPAGRTPQPFCGTMLRAWLSGHVLPAFAGILVVDAAVAQRSARLQVPDPRPLRDGLIAATAHVHGMTVVTRNVNDFAPTGVPTLDPWAAP